MHTDCRCCRVADEHVLRGECWGSLAPENHFYHLVILTTRSADRNIIVRTDSLICGIHYRAVFLTLQCSQHLNHSWSILIFFLGG